jgi:flavin-dependent dehydrogenase
MRDFLATEPLPCYANRSSWGGDGRLVDYDFIRDRYGHGWHIDRGRFDRILLHSAIGAGAKLLRGTAMAVIQQKDDRWSVSLSGGGEDRTLDTALILDCSGRRASVARRLGFRRRHFDQLMAATAYLTAVRPLADSTTLVEAVPEGWWYSAPIPGMRLAIAFMTDPDLFALTRAHGREGWSARLESTVHTRARVREGAFRLDVDPVVAAAGSSRLEQIAGEGWLAAGDAAAAHDPLSSHGIGTGIAAGSQAASAAVSYLRGDPNALQDYRARIEAGFDRYLSEQRRYYAEVRRWPGAPFWSRRAEHETALTPAALAG